MALGINTFTTQEALNYDAYNEWNYEELDLGTALAGYKSSSYIKANNPAKKVVIYPVPGQTVAANDNLYIYLNDSITQYFPFLDSSIAFIIKASFNFLLYGGLTKFLCPHSISNPFQDISC